MDGPDKDMVLTITTGSFLIPALFYADVAAGGVYSVLSAESTPKEL